MKKLMLTCSLLALVASCAPVMQPPLPPLDRSTARTAGNQYTPKINNFQVLLDSSLSMDENGTNDFLVARDIVRRMNQGIPTDLNYNAGLRSIGHSSYQSTKPTDLLYGMSAYNQAAFHDALGKIRYVGGETPMATALQAAGSDLKSAAGKNALIIVSDGLDIDDAPAAAKEIKGMLGENLCIYTIAVGNENNGAGQDQLQKIADAGQCGFATTDVALADAAGMKSFIDKVFIGDKKPAPKPVAVVVAVIQPLDSDGDGVTDDKDQCPNTPRGTAVDNVGCPLDSDGDGVTDDKDKCPNTAKGVSVDSEGCATKLTLKINFGLDSNTVAEKDMTEIAKAAACINSFPGNVVYVDGHTDSQGAAAYNQSLSERRAAAVVQALVEKFDIPRSRLTARGFGESQPITGNATEEERLQNRRVDVVCGATE